MVQAKSNKMHLEVNNDLELPFPEEIESLIRSLPLGQSKGIRSFSTTRMLLRECLQIKDAYKKEDAFKKDY